MRAGSHLALVPAVLAWSIVLVGCGASERDQVQAKVEQFGLATAQKDYKTLCGQVLAPTLLDRLQEANVPCVQGMRIALGAVRNPVLSIGRITVRGATATAVTLSGARGEEGSLDSIDLIKTRNGWRIDSLGPLGAPPP